MSTLRLVHSEIVSRMTDFEAVKRLDQLHQLVRCTCDLQSEPSKTASELSERLQAFDPLKQVVFHVSDDIQRGNKLAVHDWLLLCYLAALKCVLRSRWDDCYTVIFDAYSELGRDVNKVLAFIEEIPFAAAATLLEGEWGDDGKKPEFDIAALTFVRMSGLIGVFGGPHLYERVSKYLAYENKFLVVVLAAACFKVPAIASRVNIGDWTDTQYDCMRVLDSFVNFGETTWG